MTWRKIISWMLLCCILLSMALVSSGATTTADVNTRWNIMLVVDGSGSLYSGARPSDKDGLRYEALSMLIDSLQGSGNNVGAVVFNANATRETSWEAMYQGISLDTGLRPITSVADKERLKQEIQRAPYSGNTGGDTDIGTALLVAQQHLSQTNNGLRNAIFLFSDGEMELDYASAREQAYKHLDTACDNIREDDIKLFGVFLNCNNSYSTEVRDIVVDCKNDDSPLDDQYLEINSAIDVTNATDIFSKFLGYNLGEEEDITEIKYIRIPGIGVEEANIRIRTSTGEDLPSDMKVIITQPDGTPLSQNEMKSICSQGRTYQIYKLLKPECGVWTVKVELPEDSNIDIKYRPILSVNVDAGLETTPDYTTLNKGDTVTVTAYLEQNGNRISDPLCYREYTCMFYMKDLLTGQAIPAVEIVQDASHNYTLTMPLEEYTRYEVYAAFTCGQINVPTPSQEWDLTNNAPTCNSSAPVNEVYGLFQQNTKILDLQDPKLNISDAEDGFSDLTIEITSGTCNLNAITRNGDVLELDAKNIGNGDFVITVTDTQGASCEVRVNVTMKNITLVLILIMVTALITVVIIVIVTIRSRNNTRTNGNCAIIISVPIGDSGDTKDVACRGLTPPGAMYRARTLNLYEMLETDMNNTMESSIRRNCEHAMVKYEDYINTVNSIQVELTKTTVTAKFFHDKVKGSKKKVLSSDMICLKSGKVKDIIRSGQSSTVNLNKIKVTFLYSATGAQKDEDDFDINTDNDLDVDVEETVPDYNDPNQWGQQNTGWGSSDSDSKGKEYSDSDWGVPSESSSASWDSAPEKNDTVDFQNDAPQVEEDPWASAWSSSASADDDDLIF